MSISRRGRNGQGREVDKHRCVERAGGWVVGVSNMERGHGHIGRAFHATTLRIQLRLL